MEARYYDGLTSGARGVELALDDDALVFLDGAARERWPLEDLSVEPLGDLVRLSRGGDARLLLGQADWKPLAMRAGRRVGSRVSRRETMLVLGLVAAAGAVAGFVFFGVPALSGPLARMTPVAFEQKMGDSFEAQLGVAFKPCTGAAGQAALAGLGRRLQASADTAFDVRVRAVHAPMVNAFALPGGQVMVTDQLIEMTDSPDELAAVIAHETAHVEKRHVMQAVWRSFGLGMVLDAVVGGGSGAGQQAVLLAGNFTDMRFSREAEAEADSRGMELLQAQGLSSQGMAPFFEKLSAKGESPEASAVLELLSSHPDSLRRAKTSRAKAQSGAAAFDPAAWAAVKAACANPPPSRLKLPWQGKS